MRFPSEIAALLRPRHRHALGTMLVVLALFSNASLAQELPDDPVEKICISLAKDILGKLQEDLKPYPHLGPIDKLILFSPEIGFGAQANFKFKKIVITRGMCHELFRLADAMAITSNAFPNEKFKVPAYAKYLAEQSLKAAQSAKPGEVVLVQAERFRDWAKLDTRSLTYEMDLAAVRRVDALLNDALAMLIGHELAHLIYQDVPVKLDYPGELEAQAEAQISRWKEARADKKGLALADKATAIIGAPSGYAPLFGILNRTHSLLDNGKGLDTHPPVICRVSYLMTHTDFFKALAKAKLSSSDEKSLTNLFAEEGRKHKLSIQSLSDLEKLMLQYLKSDDCVDYWDDPFKLISSAKADLDTFPLSRLVSDNPAVTALMTSAALQGGTLHYEVPLSAVEVNASEMDRVKCDEGLQAAARTMRIGSQNLAIQCQRYETGPTVKTIFDAISDGRTFFVNLAPNNGGEQQFILVYAIRMLYAGVPKMAKIYYLKLSDNHLGSMTAKEFFDRATSGVDMRISTQ
jgi:hypothetical protein